MKKCENESFYNQLFKWSWLSKQFNWKNDCRVIYPYITSKRRTIKTLTKMAPKSNFKIWKWFDFRHQNESIFIRLKDSIVKNYIFKTYQTTFKEKSNKASTRKFRPFGPIQNKTQTSAKKINEKIDEFSKILWKSQKIWKWISL